MTGEALLQVRGVNAGYGPLQVLFDVDLAVEAGDRVALLGTNGAGKSTLLRVITGLLTPSSGLVVFDGKDITNASPADRVARGIRMVAGGRATFPGLTVDENLRVATFRLRRDKALVSRAMEQVYENFARLGERREQLAGTLSGGEQQLLAVARALLERPRLLIIDELSLGLSPKALGELVAIVDEATAEGDVTLLVVEQSLNVAAELTTTGHFMEKGEVRFSGDVRELAARGDLARSVFFGGSAA